MGFPSASSDGSLGHWHKPSNESADRALGLVALHYVSEPPSVCGVMQLPGVSGALVPLPVSPFVAGAFGSALLPRFH